MTFNLIIMKSWEILNTEAEYVEALSEVLNSYKAFPGTSEYQEREALLKLIKEYEDQKLTHADRVFPQKKKSFF